MTGFNFGQYISVIFVLMVLMEFASALWWSFGHSEPFLTHDRLCRRYRKLRGPQRTICRKHPSVAAEIVRGSGRSRRECEHQFSQYRWNCSLLDRKSVKRILLQDTKEAAFLNGIVSAGITHTVTQGCSKGNLRQCSCLQDHDNHDMNENKYRRRQPRDTAATVDANNPFHRIRSLEAKSPTSSLSNRIETSDVEWKWGGCSDDVRYGYRISRKMMDWRYRRGDAVKDVSTLVMLHNNEAGRRAVRNNLEKVCKCHGLSGSCKFRTCWHRMPSLRRIGAFLRERYLHAVKVISTNDGRGIISSDKLKKPSKEDFVFLENSANFCRKNIRRGSLGTAGRECDASIKYGAGSCDFLCCGRGYNTHIIEVTENCHCKFEYCCKITCQKCHRKKEKTFCN